MLITSVIKDSFQEYEGMHSLVLFSHGCNLRCKRCYNLKEILDSNNILGEFEGVLENNINPLHDAVVFLGGEPTIWGQGLIKALQYVKNKNLKTKVYTNGLNPELIQQMLDLKIVDAFSVDFKILYNTKILGVEIPIHVYIKTVETTIDQILRYNIPLEIRTTKWKGVNYQAIEGYLKNKYPQVKHILTKDFLS